MNTSTKTRRHVAVALAAIGFAALAGVAPVPITVKDHFTDNTLNSKMWLPHQFGGVTLNEINQRLEFGANGLTGAASYAGLEIKNWGANWKQNFEIEADYRVNLGNVHGNKEVIAGIGLGLAGQIPENFTGYAAAIFRDDVGLKLGIARYSSGNDVEDQSVPLAAAAGHLKLEWDRSNDRLTASVGATHVQLTGVWSRFGATYGAKPMIIALGCSTIDGNISFPGSRVWFDEFQFVGVKKAR